MAKKHQVIIVPGLGDEVNKISFATRHWSGHNLEPIIHKIGWHDGEKNFTPKLKGLLELIDKSVNSGNRVSLVGLSAGGSAVLNAFQERKNVIKKCVNVCGRLRRGDQRGFRSFEKRTASSPSFAQSVILFESREKYLTINDRQKIMTVSALFGDELVPADTATLAGASNITIPAAEHIFTIVMALTFFSGRIINFLKKN